MPGCGRFEAHRPAAGRRHRHRPDPDGDQKCSQGKGVVGKFVEFFGEAGSRDHVAADRATIANMSPEYGATIGLLPVDAETLALLRFTGRSEPRTKFSWWSVTTKEQGLFRTDRRPGPGVHRDTLELDLGTVEASLAGPEAPAGSGPASQMKQRFQALLSTRRTRNGFAAGTDKALSRQAAVGTNGAAGRDYARRGGRLPRSPPARTRPTHP